MGVLRGSCVILLASLRWIGGKDILSLTSEKTIAGGSGAGPNWHGTSGVHTHITNTRIGDVELLERRYPVIVHRFGLREGSGGHGKWKGGEGCVRELEVLEGMQVSIMSEVSWGDCDSSPPNWMLMKRVEEDQAAVWT
jgi:N-methylhydantoinase B/oxoprolinase/acetone carboxylase alpha subunit